MIFTEEIAQKVLDTVDAGLASGVGSPIPGQMCVEAAVCYALGLAHGDNPPCVGYAVRSLKIKLNDSNWSSKKTRAEGLRRLAIAQLGSNTIDQIEFARRVVIMTCNTVLANELEIQGYLEHGKACRAAETLDEVRAAASAASVVHVTTAASTAVSYIAYAASTAASYIAYVATNAAYAATSAAYAAHAAAANAANVVSFAAIAAISIASYGVSDRILSDYGESVVQILSDMKSPSVEWLYLTEKGV